LPNRFPRAALAASLAFSFAASPAGAAPRPATRPAVRATAAPLPPLLTLDDARRLALANHPDLRASGFDMSAANEAVKIARSAYSPQVAANATQAGAPGGTRILASGALNDPTVIQRTALGFGLSQYVTDFGRTHALVQASREELAAQLAAGNATRDSVLLDVTQAYYAVLRADALLDVANATVRERDTLVRQAQALARAGLRSILDVSIAERDASSANQLVLQARNARIDAYADLAEAIGTSNFRVYRLPSSSALPAMPPTLDALMATALRSSPQLAEARAAGRAQAARAEAAAKLTSPTVTGYAYFGGAPFKESNVEIASPYAAAGIAVNLPIFNGGQLAAQRRQAQDLAKAADERTIEQRNALERDVHSAFEDVQTARGNVDVTAQYLRTARQAFTLTQARYRIGLSSIADLSQAQLEEEQAAIAQTNAIYDFTAREAALEFAAGVIGGSNFAPPPATTTAGAPHG
jgi:outer membrane protein